jgi:hypothetical protein
LLILNCVGGYTVGTIFTHKADKSAEIALQNSYNSDKAAIKQHFDIQFGAIAQIDSQIVRTQKSWLLYAQRRPNEQAYASKESVRLVTPLIAQRDSSYQFVQAHRKAEIDSLNSKYNADLAFIRNLHSEDYDKQNKQEWLVLLFSLFMSVVLLFLVWKLHSRATHNEIRCGVSYSIDFEGEQNLSAIQALRFAIGDGLNKRLMNGAAWIHSFLTPTVQKSVGFAHQQGAGGATKTPTPIGKFKRTKLAKMPSPSVVIPIIAVQQQKQAGFPAVVWNWKDKNNIDRVSTLDKSGISSNLGGAYRRSFNSTTPEAREYNLKKFNEIKTLAEAVGYIITETATFNDTTQQYDASVLVEYPLNTSGGGATI